MFRLMIVSAIVLAFAAKPALADMTSSQREEGRVAAAHDLQAFAKQPAVAIALFVAGKHKEVRASLDPNESSQCLSKDATASDAACQKAFARIIERVRSILNVSYGLTRALGQFDPTTIRYSKNVARRLLIAAGDN